MHPRRWDGISIIIKYARYGIRSIFQGTNRFLRKRCFQSRIISFDSPTWPCHFSYTRLEFIDFYERRSCAEGKNLRADYTYLLVVSTRINIDNHRKKKPLQISKIVRERERNVSSNFNSSMVEWRGIKNEISRKRGNIFPFVDNFPSTETTNCFFPYINEKSKSVDRKIE